MAETAEIAVYYNEERETFMFIVIFNRGFPGKVSPNYEYVSEIKGKNNSFAVFMYSTEHILEQEQEREIANLFFGNRDIQVISVDNTGKWEIAMRDLTRYTVDLRTL